MRPFPWLLLALVGGVFCACDDDASPGGHDPRDFGGQEQRGDAGQAMDAPGERNMDAGRDAAKNGAGEGVVEPAAEPPPDVAAAPDVTSARDVGVAQDVGPPDVGVVQDAGGLVDSAADPAVVDGPVPAADLPQAPDATGDVGADLSPPLPNIGVWCDPALSDGSRNNPACMGAAKCAQITPTDGMCVIFGCGVDLPSDGIDEESCGTDYGAAYVCVDLDGEFGDAAEPYDPPTWPAGQNANLADNACLVKCVPKDAANDCAPEFSCAADSTRLHFDGAVCYFVACQGGADCAVTVSPPGSCAIDLDCDTAGGQFCTGVQDLDGDGTLEVRACALGGECNPQNGLCDPHALGAGTAIGAPCAFDADCPDGATCVLEAPVYDTLGGIVTRAPRNGYCTKLGCRFAATLTSAACPPGSECNHNYYAGGCQPACDVGDPWGCRNNDCAPSSGLTAGCDWFGDLDCYDWSGWTFSSGLPMIGGPTGIVCDYDGPVFNTCEDMWFRTGGIGCPGVAPVGNPAGMDCWYFESATPAPTNDDPFGRCLDTTTSGPACSDYGQLCDGICTDTAGGPCP